MSKLLEKFVVFFVCYRSLCNKLLSQFLLIFSNTQIKLRLYECAVKLQYQVNYLVVHQKKCIKNEIVILLFRSSQTLGKYNYVVIRPLWFVVNTVSPTLANLNDAVCELIRSLSTKILFFICTRRFETSFCV